jgi:hypothetical protein
MKKPSFETTMKLTLAFAIICGLITIAFVTKKLADEVETVARFYTVTQNNTTYTGNIIRGDDYVKITDKDGTMFVLDAAHGPISIRRSDLGNDSID